MSECVTLSWSSANLEPAPLDRKSPGEIDWFEGDLTNDADCAGAGVIISSAIPTIRTEDDDGNLTFGVTITTGLVYRVGYTLDAATPDKMYGILVTITLSDGRTLRRWHTLPVYATRFGYA